MLKVIEYLRDGFTYFIDLIQGLGGVIVAVVRLLGHAVAFLGSVFGHLPTLFSVALVALVAVSVIYKVLGREGQD